MLREDEVRGIRQGVKDGMRGPVMLKWVEQLLNDRDERLKRDREIAGRLLAGSQGEDEP